MTIGAQTAQSLGKSTAALIFIVTVVQRLECLLLVVYLGLPRLCVPFGELLLMYFDLVRVMSSCLPPVCKKYVTTDHDRVLILSIIQSRMAQSFGT